MSLAAASPAAAEPAGPLPLVGVVIPVFNDWLRLQCCLEALARQDYPSARLRLRVVDNGSSDWPEAAHFPLPLELLHCSEPGSYRARNLAALNWDVELLAFTDADCRPAASPAPAGNRHR
ncbi:MAG: glycosyltransferase family A protein [Prochlorococcaceae cyanobacterium]